MSTMKDYFIAASIRNGCKKKYGTIIDDMYKATQVNNRHCIHVGILTPTIDAWLKREGFEVSLLDYRSDAFAISW